MKTNTTNHLTNETPEIILGWNTMPTYGEVLPDLIGAQHLNSQSPLSGTPRENSLLTSFWDAIRGTMAS